MYFVTMVLVFSTSTLWPRFWYSLRILNKPGFWRSLHIPYEPCAYILYTYAQKVWLLCSLNMLYMSGSYICSLHVLNASCPLFSTCTQCVLSFVLYMYSMRLVLCSLHVLNASCSFVLYMYSMRLVLLFSTYTLRGWFWLCLHKRCAVTQCTALSQACCWNPDDERGAGLLPEWWGPMLVKPYAKSLPQKLQWQWR